ncbi:hypothetical protein LQF12_09015 [Ruania suaedae]|uniref:hypothetical protein n=1 Tax=Ruania suaedae TaxID=2897774 RepID=UPI001E5C13E3|nr:hypothetical protein [Ruania suaedae]UFU01668.1 hypothetical protein LQF12_09015 [Ruania suaedae]
MTDAADLVTLTVTMAASPVVLVLTNLLWVVVVVGAIVGSVIVLRRRRNRPDPSFVGAPLAHAVVIEQKFRYRMVGERRLYRITYQVHTADGRGFLGWEQKYLSLLRDQPRFAAGTQHRVAYLPAGTDEVRSTTPTS